MRKLIILTPTLDQYGSARTLRAIIEKSRTLDIDSLEVWFPPDVHRNHELFPDSSFVKYVEVDFPILRRKYIRNFHFFSMYLRGFRNISALRNSFRNEEVQLYVHCFTLAPILAAWIAPKNNRQLSIHEITSSRFEKSILTMIAKKYFVNIIFASNYLKNKYSLSGMVVHSGADIEKYLNIPFVQISDGKTIQILCIGRFNYWKGQHSAIEAACILKSFNLNFQMIFLGSGFENNSYLFDCQELVREYELEAYVKFIGEVNDITEIITPIHFLLLPSIKPEPFGKVVVEGMAAGKVVIATRLGGPSEVISDGENGALVEHNSPSEIAEKIIELVSNPSRYVSISKQGRIRSKDFSESAMSEKYAGAFKKLIS
jgi:glycosyltransferase involved in cell wall biosynthesis